eukprot:CAMPEP_0194782460 /NCGR_PEP_ID=MMETSP0323_2-20130528/78698_1 /TAXON_ID=2866 ORGANISM="Crypthecodinium cohnii, Strain Seligo" /NCGR_SAMPLE_ID=MMETSP0323_2 /ASSEMBLY_ACC=CAM_ASM_000346 /LENGTH=160 /DNA_ID=CAMNT_0039721269 /DNA_START=64 /DNA_END=546 /DNA_ORIENTATION=+
MSATAAAITSQTVPMEQVASQAPVTYVVSQPSVTYAAPPITSQYVADWSSTSVPITSMAYPGGYTSGSAAVPVASTGPALYSCPPELFAKLAAGGTLTAEEMAQITGQAPPAPTSVTDMVADAVADVAEVASKKKKSSSSKKSKKALKASSKKSKKGCCA